MAAMLLLAVLPARAQDLSAQNPSADERRCTGLWRATSEERVASCTTLIDSGRYQPVNLAILHDNRGMAFRAKGDLTNARSDFDQAISLNQNYTRGYANRGNLAFAQRDFDGAIADFNQAIKLDAAEASLFMARGNAYDGKDDGDRAIADYDQAIKLYPTAAAYNNRGSAWAAKGEIEPFALGVAAVDIGIGQTRIEFYRLIVIGNRAVEIAFVA